MTMKSYNFFFCRAIIIAIFCFGTACKVIAQNFVFHAEFANTWAGPGYNFVNDINILAEELSV